MKSPPAAPPIVTVAHPACRPLAHLTASHQTLSPPHSCAGKTHSRIPDEAPGWEEVLASDSEAIVKSERSKDRTMKEMQDETLNCLRDEMGEGEGGTPGGVQERR